MGELSIDSNLSFTCSEFFMTKYCFHNGCTFNIKGHVRNGVLKILTLVILKWPKESTYDNRMISIYL